VDFPLRGSQQSLNISTGPVPWRVGEHVAVIGTTGTGKTYLVSELVKRRRYVTIFRTKPDDIDFKGFKEHPDARALEDWRNELNLIRPKYQNQPRVGYDLLEKVWEHGRWTIVIDEFFYVERLGLKQSLERLLTQGRSKKISVVLGMQRPVQVTRFALSEVSHIFCFRLEGRDATTLRDMTSPDIIKAVQSLQKYQFVHYHIPTKTIRIGNAQSLDKVISPVQKLPAQLY